MKIEALIGSTVVFRTGPASGAMAGRKGDLAPSFELNTEAAAGIERVLNYRIGARDIDIPLWVKTNSRVAALNIIQDLLIALAPGDITLRFTTPENRIRQLQGCYLTGGLEDDGFENLDATEGAQFVLSFKCPDPYWYSPTLTSETFTVSLSSLTTFFPFFPLMLTASSIIERKIITNPGASIWPIWILNGPGENPTIMNHTTGESITLIKTLVTGDVLVIDTIPLAKTVILNGANAYQYLTADSVMFDIEPGDNDISVQMNLFVVGTSIGTLQYYPRYLSL